MRSCASLPFDDLPPPLDEADRDVALGTAIDSVDRAMRQYPGRRFLDCIPRMPGTVEATIDDGPRGRLTEPLAVTCTTTATTSDLRAWQADHRGRLGGERRPRRPGPGHVGSCSTPRVPCSWRPTSSRGPVSPSRSPATQADGPRRGRLLRARRSRALRRRRCGDRVLRRRHDASAARAAPVPRTGCPGGHPVRARSVRRPRLLLADTGDEVGWVGVEGKGVPCSSGGAGLPGIDRRDRARLPSVLERRRCASRRADPRTGAGRAPELDPSGGGRGRAGLAGRRTDVGAVRRGRDGLDPGLPVALAPTSTTSRPMAGSPSAATRRSRLPRPVGSSTRRSGAWTPPPDAQTRRCRERSS